MVAPRYQATRLRLPVLRLAALRAALYARLEEVSFRTGIMALIGLATAACAATAAAILVTAGRPAHPVTASAPPPVRQVPTHPRPAAPQRPPAPRPRAHRAPRPVHQPAPPPQPVAVTSPAVPPPGGQRSTLAAPHWPWPAPTPGHWPGWYGWPAPSGGWPSPDGWPYPNGWGQDWPQPSW